jgi:hypothetical protein
VWIDDEPPRRAGDTGCPSNGNDHEHDRNQIANERVEPSEFLVDGLEICHPHEDEHDAQRRNAQCKRPDRLVHQIQNRSPRNSECDRTVTSSPS